MLRDALSLFNGSPLADIASFRETRRLLCGELGLEPSRAPSTRISMRRCRVELASLPLSKGRGTRRSVGRHAVGDVTECAPDPGEGDE
jgi:hypothetical protein